MILARAHQYALLALIELARLPRHEFLVCRDIAARFGLPTHYLSKLMQQMVQAGLVESVRGRHGGYRLARAPEKVKVSEIIHVLDTEFGDRQCVLGLKACSDETACALHTQWRPVREGLDRLLDRQTLRQMAR